MRDFSALLMHVRDLRAEIAALNTRASTLSQRLEALQSGGAETAAKYLHEAVAEFYSLSELNLLAASLGLNHEELDGQKLSQAALDLVLWANRHGKIARLLGLLREQRPHVQWGGYKS